MPTPQRVSELLCEHELERFFVVPHTHWDREWYRPFEYFQLELGRVVDGVIDALERDQRFASFTLDGQAIVLEDYLAICPDHEPRLRALLAGGRIEVGPSYVLPDEFLVGAESLVRNLLIGRAVCKRFGVDPTPVGYMPDSFGHPLQLPQILAGFGLESFIFSRGLGDELDELGVVFRWRAPDGSEVLALQQLPHYGNFAAVSGADDGLSRVQAIVEAFGPGLQAAGVHDLLLCNGSDHLPVQPELPELCSELEQRLGDVRFLIAGYRDYVRAIGRPQVTSHEGELLGSRIQNVLRGVNSARLYIKQANERAERRLLSVETLAALRSLLDGTPFPSSDFALAWRKLLRCQPHDSICGCSCDEVHRDMLVRYESVHRTLDVLESRALEALTGDPVAAPQVGIANPLPYRRRALVEVAGAGTTIAELDGFAARTVELNEPPPARPRDGSVIESDLFRVQADPSGALTVLDKRSGRQFENLHLLEDELDMGDLYNFCPVDGSSSWRSDSASVQVVRDGPDVWELELDVETHRPAGLETTETAAIGILTVVRLVRSIGRVEFRTTVDNRARDHRLRVLFDAGTAVSTARAEGQFAVVHRELGPAPLRADWVEPPDATQHTLGAVAVGPIALLTKGLPEYEASSDGQLRLTLLRCVGLISRPSGAIATRPQGAGPALETPDGQCLGRCELEYALLTDADGLDDTALVRESQDFRYGFVVAPPGVEFDPPLGIDGDVVFSCLKGAEDGDGLIVRCFNPRSTDVSVRFVGPILVSRTRLDETEQRAVGDRVVALAPYQVGTVRLRAIS